jgi:hypothetical protein
LITNTYGKFGTYSAIESVSRKDREMLVNGFVDSALLYAAQCKGWHLSRQSFKVKYIPDVNYSGKQLKTTSKAMKKRNHEDSRPTSASVLEEDDNMYWSKLDDDDILVDTPQQQQSQQQAPSSPMQSTGTKSRKVIQGFTSDRNSTATATAAAVGSKITRSHS